MKKRIIICMLISVMVCGNIASCGKESGSGSKSAAEETTTMTAAEAETTTEKATEAETTTAESTEAAETTATAANNNGAAEDHLADAAAVLNNINNIDGIGGGAGVETDTADTKQEGSDTYAKVTDSRFTTVDDVKKYVTDAICGTLLDRYKFLYEGDDAYFKEFDGALSFMSAQRGSGFSYTGEPVITDVTDDSFTATVPFDNFGGSSDLAVKAVKEDGKWKASSFSVDGGAENVR